MPRPRSSSQPDTPVAPVTRSAAKRAAAAARAEAQRQAQRRAQRRRQVLRWGAAAAAVVAALGAFLLTRDDPEGSKSLPASDSGAPRVGGDLHTVTVLGQQLILGGHSAAARSADRGATWSDVASLRGADPMGWAVTSRGVLAGGHPGLYLSADGGTSFAKQEGAAAVEDVHALGAAGDRVYLASPQAGLLTSRDAGRTWQLVSSTAGRSFMGTILIDPSDPARLVAPDMANGLMTSPDAGRTWTGMGGPMGSMSVTWNAKNTKEIIAIGMEGGQRSTDGGATWQQLQLPAGTSAVSYDPADGSIYAGALEGERGRAYRSTDAGATWTATS